MGFQGLKGSDGTPGYNGHPGAKGEPGQTGPPGKYLDTQIQLFIHYMLIHNFIKPHFLFCRAQRVPRTPRAWWYPRSHRPSRPFLNGPWLPCNPPQSDYWSSILSTGNDANLWWIFAALCPGQWKVTWARSRSAQKSNRLYTLIMGACPPKGFCAIEMLTLF